MKWHFFLRLSETFDRFDIDTLEDQRHSNGHHDRRRQSLRDRSRRSNRHRGSSRERSSMRHERSRSRSMHQHARKSSVKDRLGTPVKKPSKQPMSPQPSTSKQEPKHERHCNFDEPDANANRSQTLDEVYDTDDNQETFDMSDLDSILSKCICKFTQPK